MGALQRKEAARKERMGKNVRREFAGAEVKPTEYGVNVMLPFEGTAPARTKVFGNACCEGMDPSATRIFIVYNHSAFWTNSGLWYVNK